MEKRFGYFAIAFHAALATVIFTSGCSQPSGEQGGGGESAVETTAVVLSVPGMT